MNNTNKQYDEAVQQCREIFLKKSADYGTSWRVLRTISVVDQIFIKAKRIRNLQENTVQKVKDDIASEFKGILNYAIIGLIQIDLPANELEELAVDKAGDLYNEKITIAKALMQDKNHDYGEAWRDMSQQSFTDLIMVKLKRIKQILLNEGKTIMSEGIDANYLDIMNYAIFALILIGEKLEDRS